MITIDEIVTDDDVAAYTKLGERRYKVVEFRPTEPTRAAFANLPLDPYCGEDRGHLSNRLHRFRRYDDFRVSYRLGRWTCELLPHRSFIQSPRFKKAVGGAAPILAPLEIDPSNEINSLLSVVGFETAIKGVYYFLPITNRAVS